MNECPVKEKCIYYPGACTGITDEDNVKIEESKVIICDGFKQEVGFKIGIHEYPV